MLIRPVLTYSSETLALTKNDIRMMDRFERRLVFTRHKLNAMDSTCCAVTILASDLAQPIALDLAQVRLHS
jgi:hypothetical protein